MQFKQPPPGGWPVRPAKPNRTVLLLIPAAFGFICLVAGIISASQRHAVRAEREERDLRNAAAQAWLQQQANMPATAPSAFQAPTPGTCDTVGASNPNRTPQARQDVASTLEDSFRRHYGGNARVSVQGGESDVLAVGGLSNCSFQLQQLIERLGAGDYNSSARVLCTAYGFRRITCDPGDGSFRTLDLNRDCVCSSRWDCTCPVP